MTFKASLLELLRARIASDLAAVERRQRDAQAGSTHEESRAEHAKDTRATEQSYLARGLAERVEALRDTAAALAAMQLRTFGPKEPIALTALVTLEAEGGATAGEAHPARETWWLVANAGGLELEHEGRRVRTITPASPLGRALIGLEAGDEGQLRTPRGARAFEVIAVE